MKIAIFEAEQWEREACRRLEPLHHVSCTRAALTAKTAHEHADAEILSPFVYSKLDASVLSQFPSLQLIATRSTGYDHLDLGYCKRHRITVCNVPDYGDSTVAEHVFALLLGIARHLPSSVKRTLRGQFSQTGLRGFELHGKTLGVVGTGRIGRRVIEIAKGFGMTIIASDQHPDLELSKQLGFSYVALDQVLSQSDIITLHVPATPETTNLISDAELALMRPHTVLINTARGSVVDVEALVRALDQGRLGAAGLDVLPYEPALRDEAEIFRTDASTPNRELTSLLASHALLRFPNVLVTPHNAYNTSEAIRRIIDTTLDNIEAYAQGSPRNVVTQF